MFEALRNALKLPDLRRRILYTILILVIFRMASNIPVPGVDRVALDAFFKSSAADATRPFLGLMDLLSGGAVSNFSILAAGVYPYVTATLVIQLLLPIFPKWEKRIQEEGEEGQRKMNQWSFYITVPLAGLQAFAQAQLFRQATIGMNPILPHFGWEPANLLPTFTLLLSMIAGTMFAIWLGELISEQGIGNGLSLIIFGGIVSRVPANLKGIWSSDGLLGVIIFLVITVVTILFIVFIQNGERRIKVQYGKRVRGMKVYGGGSTYIPLKVNTAGMIPLIFAQSILAFPAVIAQFFMNSSNPRVQDISQGIITFFGGKSPGYIPLYFAAVAGFTYFYTFVMVEQQKLPDMLQKQGGFIPGVRPGQRTEEFIHGIYRRITLVDAVFLGLVAVLPLIMGLFMKSNQMIIQSSGLLIVVGTVMETMRQLESQLLMRNYEGFLR
ncbi:MAG: preprotein translocase subunit SecY [Anaerolineae bacterium]|nr:preprotein translocase subunit SecY [Anaerolineae bacterium]